MEEQHLPKSKDLIMIKLLILLLKLITLKLLTPRKKEIKNEADSIWADYIFLFPKL